MWRQIALVVSAVALGAATDPNWRPLDLENTLVIDTSRGRVLVELRPEFAPSGVMRIKTLAREGVYDGLLFHRVIDGFVAQTGNPNNRDGGASAHPDLAPEFQFRLAAGRGVIFVHRSDVREGLVGASPFSAVSALEQARDPASRLRAWGAYCKGVVGMGRQADPASGNSEIFFMRASARRLDHEYTAVGVVVDGMDIIEKLEIGEPPQKPDGMTRVRVASDLAAADRPDLQIEREDGPNVARRAAALRRAKGADFSICDMTLETRR